MGHVGSRRFRSSNTLTPPSPQSFLFCIVTVTIASTLSRLASDGGVDDGGTVRTGCDFRQKPAKEHDGQGKVLREVNATCSSYPGRRACLKKLLKGEAEEQ